MADYGLPLGAKRALFWKVMTGGYMGGTAGDDLAADTVSSPYLLDDIKTADPAPIDAEVITQTGGDIRIAQVTIGDRPVGAFNLATAGVNPAFWAWAAGGAVDETNTLVDEFSTNPANLDLPTLGLAIQRQYYRPYASANKRYWITQVFPNASVEPKSSNYAERQFSEVGNRIVPDYSSYHFGGEQFSESAKMKLTDGKTDCFYIVSADPIHIVVYKVPDTAAPTLQLPYLPTSNVVTLNATPNRLWRNGTLEALTSISTSTGEAVAATGAANDILVLAYATNYVAVA